MIVHLVLFYQPAKGRAISDPDETIDSDFVLFGASFDHFSARSLWHHQRMVTEVQLF